ncbi:hypothetical protein AKJ16_DCAP02908 [Drosera capensis]
MNSSAELLTESYLQELRFAVADLITHIPPPSLCSISTAPAVKSFIPKPSHRHRRSPSESNPPIHRRRGFVVVVAVFVLIDAEKLRLVGFVRVYNGFSWEPKPKSPSTALFFQ